MRCEDIREIISLYIDNELNEEESKEIEKHLKSCEECNREYEDLLTIKRLLSEAPQVELPNNFKEELHKKLVASVSIEDSESNETNNVIDFDERSNKVRKKKLNWKVFSGVAAALFLTVVSLSAIMNDIGMEDMPKMHMEEAAPEQDISFNMANEKAEYSGELAKQAPMDANEAEMDSYSLDAPVESEPELATSDDRADAIRSMEKKIILIEEMIIQVEDYDWTFGSIEKLISDKGGYIQSSNTTEKKADESSDEEALKTGNLVARVSNSEFDNVIGELTEMGTIVNDVTSSNDVTNEYNLASTELMNLELQEKEISEGIEAGETTYEGADAEKALTSVREEMVKIEANINRWDDLVELATIHINLEEVVLADTE